MKIKTCEISYLNLLNIKPEIRFKPRKPHWFFRFLMKSFSKGELKKTNFKYVVSDEVKNISNKTPILILMNHSAFIDLKIASTIFSKRLMNIVCTSDGIVGKKLLMRLLGCVPTNKFITDLQLVSDLKYCVNELHDSVLLYPEASYSFDGRATVLPTSISKLVRLLNIPVVMVKTHGAFLHDPLYNSLQQRKCSVTAEVKLLLNKDDIQSKTDEQIFSLISEEFKFDNFKEQINEGILINESFRCDGLNRVLYKCPHCGCESKMEGNGTKLICHNCHIEYMLNENGTLKCSNNEGKFDDVTSWYDWQKEEVKKEILNNKYCLQTEVNIGVIKDTKALYMVGKGTLIHDDKGFTLDGARGAIHYTQSPLCSYSLYSDYHWYEIGDMIAIGNNQEMFYCFPLNKDVNVAKARIATEYYYKLNKEGTI